MTAMGLIARVGRSPREAPISLVVPGTVLGRAQPASLMACLAPVRPQARNGSANLLPRREPRLPREPRSPAAAVLRSRSGLTVQAGRPVAPSTAIEAALGGFGNSQENDMAQIGTFTRDESGAYSGTIKTLTISVKASIKPCDRDNDKAPDYRVTANGVEFGAGWSRTARETGAEYLSLKLDDPSFTAPVYASLVQGDKGEHKLIWSR